MGYQAGNLLAHFHILHCPPYGARRVGQTLRIQLSLLPEGTPLYTNRMWLSHEQLLLRLVYLHTPHFPGLWI